MFRSLNIKERATQESEERRPHRLRLMLIRYAFAGVAVLAVEMLLVGRWLFVVPLIALVLAFVWGRGIDLLLSALLLAVTMIPALLGWWWPVWWRMDASLTNYVYIGAWHEYPPVLALVRWLLALALPVAWYIPTALAYTRFAVETLLPEFPNVTPLEALRSWAIWKQAQPEPEMVEREPLSYGYTLEELPQKQNGETWFFNDFPADVLDMFDPDEITAADKLRSMFSALLTGTTYSRPEWCKRRKHITQDAWHALNTWMLRNHYVRKLPGNAHEITRAGHAMMQAVIDKIDALHP
jgi:hypothetical protein